MDLEGLVEHDKSESDDCNASGTSVRSARTRSASRGAGIFSEKRRVTSCAVGAIALVGIGLLSHGQGWADLPSTGSISSVQSLAYAHQCMQNEELFEGLCYKKCSDLTTGSASVRRGTDSCCKSSRWWICLLPFTSDSALALGIGGGEGVLARPHAPGIGFSCGSDEEIWMTVCYKKCSIITNGTLPTRSGPSECCSATAPGGCISSDSKAEKKSSFAFAAGAHPPGFDKDHEGAMNQVVFEKKVNDDGMCESDEEGYKGLCYATCDELTNSTYSHRTGPMTCCKSKFSLMCSWPGNVKSSEKFDVAGNGRRPHIPGLGGTCLKDEEEYLGACYSKCSIAAGADYPIRTGVAQCCNEDSKCLVSPSFDIGGAETANFVLPGSGTAPAVA